jgi:hypothetical protein
VSRYFKEGPNGRWRDGVRAVEIITQVDGQTLQIIHYHNKARGRPTTVIPAHVEYELNMENWVQTDATWVFGRSLDTPLTGQEAAW